MSTVNENSFWKPKISRLPGCIKSEGYDTRFQKKRNSFKSNFPVEHVSENVSLDLSIGKKTALQVIQSHNKEHGQKNIKPIEDSFRSSELPKYENESNSCINAKNGDSNDNDVKTEKESTEKLPSEIQQNGHLMNDTPSLPINNTTSETSPITPTTLKLPEKPLQIPISPSSPTFSDNKYSEKSKNFLASGFSQSNPTSPTTASNPLRHVPLFPGKGIRSKNFQTSKNTIDNSLKFSNYLLSEDIQLATLKKMCWSGIPHQHRSLAWKLLCSYIPLNPNKREGTLARKRGEYKNLVGKYYDDEACRNTHHEAYHQIHIDIPRMSPCIPLFQQVLVQKIFERVLFIWAIRHPASGYVQGMNDLLTPFFIVFIHPHLPEGEDYRNFKVDSLFPEVVDEVEADSFWCFSRLLDGIQDNYTFAQPGIQVQVNMLKELMGRINFTLHQHLMANNIEYLQFAFRWVNNLLMRELPLLCCVRLWDTYLCETDGFASFHLYVCATLLHRFSTELLNEHDFQGLMLYLKNLPTDNWCDSDVGLLLADAYRLKYAFADAPRHLMEK